MTLPLPNLDDRDFNQLVEEARQRIREISPDWTDLGPSDPGMTLVELFAYLTESLLYRVNRLPEKAYVAFLRLIGVRLQPPGAARTRLVFSLSDPATTPVTIPRGTRVAAARGNDAPIFGTMRDVVIPVGVRQAAVAAIHADPVSGELAGLGNGLPGQTVTARRTPIIGSTGDPLDLLIGVEITGWDGSSRIPAFEHEGKVYRIWREVLSFADPGADRFVYLADRATGTVTFAPAARLVEGTGLGPPALLAEVPPAGREIRLWYRHGGGLAGNVSAGTLTVLKDPIGGVTATNPEPAAGGSEVESIQNALIRGPQQLRSLDRAITARDFEAIARAASPGVARSRALTRSALWAHARPGSVEVLLVPAPPGATEGAIRREALHAAESDLVRAEVSRAIDDRRPLGITSVVNWARYKEVTVAARVVVRSEEDRQAVHQRIRDRLDLTITPLPTRLSQDGWPFGQAIRASNVYDIALAEPGVRWIDRVRLRVGDVPSRAVSALAADQFQDRTWYAGSEDTAYRTLNQTESWEPIGRFAGEIIERVVPSPLDAGWPALLSRQSADAGSAIRWSDDAGESWSDPVTTSFLVREAAWAARGPNRILLLATDAGVFELSTAVGGTPVPVLPEDGRPIQGCYAIATVDDGRGTEYVAVALQQAGGVLLSQAGGRGRTFQMIGLAGEDLRVLTFQREGGRTFLWAGAAAAGSDTGKGCFRTEIREGVAPTWTSFAQGWEAGSCFEIAMLDEVILAASHRGGVMRLNLAAREPVWQRPNVRSGLPLRDPGRFHPVTTVAVDPGRDLIFAGGPEGVYRSADGGENFALASATEFTDRVLLPGTWLFCSGEHQIDVVSEDETTGD